MVVSDEFSFMKVYGYGVKFDVKLASWSVSYLRVIVSCDCSVAATNQPFDAPNFSLWIVQGLKRLPLRGFEKLLEDETGLVLVVQSLDKKRNSTALPKTKSAAQCNSLEPAQPKSSGAPDRWRILQCEAK